MPPSLSFQGACTLPILWCTARLALAECARLRARQHILIPATTGGIGLVALEFVERVGSVASGSAGRPSKVAYLHLLGVPSVASSRDASAFTLGRVARLNGSRLHVVVSALTKGFIPASLVLLSDHGCYLEVGRNNIWSEGRVAAAVSCSPLCLVAADYQSAEWVRFSFGRLSICRMGPLQLWC